MLLIVTLGPALAAVEFMYLLVNFRDVVATGLLGPVTIAISLFLNLAVTTVAAQDEFRRHFTALSAKWPDHRLSRCVNQTLGFAVVGALPLVFAAWGTYLRPAIWLETQLDTVLANFGLILTLDYSPNFALATVISWKVFAVSGSNVGRADVPSRR